MNELSQQRCFRHQHREAVVRCPDCRRYFCRECVTEHHDRMLCAHCLAHLSQNDQKRSRRWVGGFLMLAQGIFGFLLLWYAFYLAGLALLSIPHPFHEGTFWEANWWEPQ